jgi:hypothetical protein
MDSRAIYDDVVGKLEGVERKGKTMPYTSLNGHMFSFVSQEDTVGVRLSKIDREESLENHEEAMIIQHGHIMKEYVRVPAAFFENVDLLKEILEQSHAYVASLKPKATKKSKK